MRIVALLRASAIDLSAVETVVLDEGAFQTLPLYLIDLSHNIGGPVNTQPPSPCLMQCSNSLHDLGLGLISFVCCIYIYTYIR